MEAAQRESGKTYLSVDDPEVLTTAKHLILEAAAPFDNPDLRDALVKTQQRDEQIIDIVSQDRLLTADWDIQAEDSARQTITTFQQFIEQHRDEIAALQIFYSRPRAARLRYEDVKQLNEAIARPPLGANHRQTLAGLRNARPSPCQGWQEYQTHAY